MRIAIPDHPLVAPLVQNAVGVCERLGWTLLRVSADQAEDMLATNRADVALVSPLAYGKASGIVEYNIVPNTCVALSEYTATMGIIFPHDVASIRKIGAENPNNFLVVIGALMLRERYEASAEPVLRIPSESTARESAVTVDCIIGEPQSSSRNALLDVSEEFYDFVESPLPVFLWVCRLDGETDKLSEAIQSMANRDLPEVVVTEQIPLYGDSFPREGKILYRWSDDVEEGLTAVLNLLYFHQTLNNLPEIKLLPSEFSTDDHSPTQ